MILSKTKGKYFKRKQSIVLFNILSSIMIRIFQNDKIIVKTLHPA